MTGGLWQIAAAAALLLISHFGLSSTAARPALIARIGYRAYLGVYSALALLALAWLVAAYIAAPPGPLMLPIAPIGAFLAVIVMPVALLLLVGGYSQKNPTALGMSEAMGAEPAGVLRITRHPVMWGVGLWALAHILARGTLANLLFFGAFAVLALVGTLAIDARNRAAQSLAFRALESETSNLPLAAIIDGRQHLGRALQEMGPWRLVATVALYAVLLHFHGALFGVRPYAGFW